MRIKSILIGFLFSIRILAGSNQDLLESVRLGNAKLVLAALAKGADANYKANNIKPLLSIAAEKGNLDVIQALLDKGAKINATEKTRDTPGWTALMHATEDGKIEVVKLLLKNGANKNQKNGKGYDALYLAELWGHSEIISLLKGDGVDGKKDYPSEKMLSRREMQDSEKKVSHRLCVGNEVGVVVMAC